MKKLFTKSMLVVLLVSLCMPVAARTTSTKTIAKDDPVTGAIDDAVFYSAADGTISFHEYISQSDYYAMTVPAGKQLVFTSIAGAFIENIEITAGYHAAISGSGYKAGGSKTVSATRDGATIGSPSATTNSGTISISFSPDNAPDMVVIKPSSDMWVVTMKVSYSKVPADVDGYYFIRNVATGLHLKYGATWGSSAAEGNAAHPFVFNKLSNGKYEISSIGGYLQHGGALAKDDGQTFENEKANSQWSVEPVEGSTNRYHLLTPTMRMLASSGVEGGQVALLPYDATDERMQWELVTPEQLRVEKSAAELGGSPVDMTPLIKAASFDLYDALQNDTYPLGGMTAYREYWKYEGRDVDYDTNLESDDMWDYSWHQVNRDGTPDGYSMSNVFRNNVRRPFTFFQNLGKLPAGTYTLSFEGFVRGINRSGYSSYSDNNPTVTVDVVGADKTTLTQKACTLAVNTKLGRTTNVYNFLSQSGYQLDGTHKDGDNDRYAAKYAAQQFKEHDDYKRTITFTLNEATDNVQIFVNKTSDEVSLTNVQLLIAFDNFSLFYHGNGATDPAHGNMYYDKIVAALESAKAKLDDLRHEVTIDGEEVKIPGCPNTHNAQWNSGISSIDINSKKTSKIALLNGADVDSEEEYLKVLSIIEAAYQAALEAHRLAINELLQEEDEWLDPYIVNPSFELGNLTGWEVQNKLSDVDVFKNEGLKATNNGDGSYLFNAFDGDTNTNTPWVKQTVKGLKNGLYKLTAKLTSAAGNKVYLLADSYHSSITATDPGTFQDAVLYFLVENGTTTGGGSVTIGAIGGNNRARDGEPFEFYYPWGGCWFKADDFHLEYVCQPNLGRLKLVLNEADEAYKAFDADGKASFQATKDGKESIYTTTKKNKTDLESGVVNGHINDIYEALTTAAKVQLSKGADMTYAIANHNFELGALLGSPNTYPGWSCSTGNDTKAAMQEDGTYTVVGADGRYLFNTWDNGTAQPLTQTITGLPNGSYMVSAVLATDPGQSVTLTAGGKSITKKSEFAKNNGELVEYEDKAYAEDYCEVTDGTLTIKVEGVNSIWFKADNFRLTLVEPAVLDLYDEKRENEQFNLTRFYDSYIWINVHREIKAGSWSTLVLPFNMPVPEGWTVKKLSTDNQPEHNDGNITLRFDEVDQIEAGIPYMVQLTEGCKSISAAGAALNTLHNWGETGSGCSRSTSCGTYKVSFVGSYDPGYLPVTKEGEEEYFFVSGNKFYRSTGTGNFMKAFRAYFKIEPNSKGAPALRSLSMRIGDETIIESVEDEVTVEGIYSVDGVKLESMQPGINILRMNNGTTKKVIVK